MRKLGRIATLPHVRPALWHIAAAVAVLAAAPMASARTLLVGPGQTYTRPSQAAAAARAGDTVQIAAGTYYDCAVWNAPSLVIAGTGAATRLTDATCQGKAIMVIVGSGIVVRDLVLARARVPDGNGAGIRAEAPDLTLQRVRFEDDQDGLLAADQPGGVLRIENSDFVGDGVAAGAHPTASLVVGRWARLELSDCRFSYAKGRAAILSDAALTRIESSRIDAASPGGNGTVQAGGGLAIERSTLAASPAPNGTAAAALALPAVAGAELRLHGDTLQGGGTLLLNFSGRAADLAGNTLGDAGAEESTAGSWSFRLRRALRGAYDAARGAAGALHWRLHWRLLRLLHR